MNSISWHYWQAFLAVTEHKSLSAAATNTQQSQPTLSRQIQQLENKLQTQLFQRTPKGLVPTAEATRLIEHVKSMSNTATQLERQVQGFHEKLTGSVSISANEIVGIYILPSILSRFRQEYSEIKITLSISNNISSLSQREADIALRMVEPLQPDLVRQRLPNLKLGFFASKAYLRRHGTPNQYKDLAQHQMIGFDNSTFYQIAAREMSFDLTSVDFAFGTDHMLAQLALARADGGIIVTHTALASQWPELTQILPETPSPSLPFYLLCHEDTRHNAIIRTLTNYLWKALKKDPYQTLLI